MTKRIAIVLFNLGGPDKQSAVKPFLFNLFNDRAIINLPNPFRFLLAKLISSRREKEAQHIYAQMGGGSPILPMTEEQAAALDKALNVKNGVVYKVVIAMRYWYPRARDAINELKEFMPDEVILLPLYPQFSTTTTDSSAKEWKREMKRAGMEIKTKTICCYPVEKDFVAAHVALIKPFYERAALEGAPRILFSAHGLPEKIIEKGDPYQWQVEKTAAAIVNELNIANLDWKVTYQSRVGPMKWIGPYTDEEILKAAKEKTPLVIVPVAFVSEHSETLVELDMQYRKLASDNGLEDYYRVPALATSELYIKALSAICQRLANENGCDITSGDMKKICPQEFSCCPCVG